MEFLTSIWKSSLIFRIAVCVVALGMVLVVVNGERNAPPPGAYSSDEGGLIEKIKNRLPGRSLPVRAKDAADKAVGVVEKSVDIADKTVDKVTGAIDKVSNRFDQSL